MLVQSIIIINSISAAAGATQPLAENCPGRDHPAIPFAQGAVRDLICPVARIEMAMIAANRLVETAKREPFGNPVDLADHLQPQARPDQPAEDVRQALLGAFQAGRDDSAGDHSRLEQAEIILGEIENLVQGDDSRSRSIHADQPQHGPVDHAEIDFDRGDVAAGAHKRTI